MAKKKAKRSAIRSPKDLKEAEKFLQQLGEAKHEVDKLQSELDQKVDALKKEYGEQAKPHQKKMERLFEGLYAFAKSNRSALTEENKRKTVSLLSGNFGWRTSPAAVRLVNTETALKQLKQKGFRRFIRTIEEVDKEAIKKEPEKVKGLKGISIDQSEIFFVRPHELELEIAQRTSRFKKKVT